MADEEQRDFTTPFPIPETEPDIARDDATPSIAEQAEAQGWKAAYYDFGKVENNGWDLFNPSLAERPDGLWLLTRVSEPHPDGFRFGQNNIFAFQLDPTGKIPKMGRRLRWLVDNEKQHFEDPRGFYHSGINQTVIGVCTFLWYPDRTWTGAHQAIGTFDEEWLCKKMDYPKVGGNPGEMRRIESHKDYEKNWLWWLHENHLHLLYKANPWMVAAYGNHWSEFKYYKNEGVTWPYGEIRGGTTPVKVGDYYFTFHHSSLPWKGKYRRYYAGAIAFESKPPFTPKLITPEPILRGSQNDTWTQRKPLVIFPCGSIYKNGNWLISCGVNDLKSAWLELPHESLLERMKPIGNVEDTIFPGSGISLIEARKEKLRANLVKARAARAAKKMAGDHGVQREAGTACDSAHETIARPKKRRRKIKRRKDIGFLRKQALAEHEQNKNLVEA